MSYTACERNLVCNMCVVYNNNKWYGDCVGRPNTAENSSIFSLIQMCSLTLARACGQLHQQNAPALNWRCQLTQADLYNGHKIVVVAVLLFIMIKIPSISS